MRALLVLVIGLIAAPGAWGQVPPVVTASAPRTVSVTVYRDPNRYQGAAIDRANPRGFALVTETRRVRVPAGVSTIRFEGVSGGIIPVSAVVSGLPGGTVEKNRDAAVLSPAALVDGTLGRLVTLRRTDRATGTVREEDATIVSGAQNGVVLRTASGVEALRCSGLAESPIFRGVPAGLSALPVLSVTTRSPRAATASVTLSYLATAFDWSASYVAAIAPDGQTLDLFAWMTLANGNAETIGSAEVSAVAGRLSRRFVQVYRAAAGELQLRCYPLGTTTSNLPVIDRVVADDIGEIVVTGSRVMRAMAPPPPPPPPPAPPAPEDLGDLKLYRVPARTDVAANQQKQVALLRQANVPFERVYVANLFQRGGSETPVALMLRMRNTAAGALGIALPSGTTSLYQDGPRGRLLLALGYTGDRAVGQKVELAAGASTQVAVEQTMAVDGRASVMVSNANAAPATVEVRLGMAGQEVREPSMPLKQIDGVWTWRVVVPANGAATFGYRYR